MARLFAIKTFSLVAIVYLLNMGSLAAAGPRGGGPMGPGDIGGGSGLKDRVYDSYIKDPRKHPSYKHIKPIFDHMSDELKKDEMSKPAKDRVSSKGTYADILLLKTWYFVPSKLKKIAAGTIGAENLTSDLQQIALQSDYDILVDTDIFNRMDPKDQADLILHEAVQLLYRLKFMPMSELCVRMLRIHGGTPCTSSNTTSKIDIDAILKAQKFHPLNKNDYYAIRTMVAWLKNKGATASVREYYTVARSLGFDQRFFNPKMLDKRETKKESLQLDGALAPALRRAQVVGRLPRICKNFTTEEEFACSLRLTPFKQPWQAGVELNATRIEVLDANGSVIQNSWFFTDSTLNLTPLDDPYSDEVRYLGMSNTAVFGKEIGTPLAMMHAYFEKNENIENAFEVTSLVFINMVLVDVPAKFPESCYFEIIHGKNAVLGVRRETEDFPATSKLSATFMRSMLNNCRTLPN